MSRLHIVVSVLLYVLPFMASASAPPDGISVTAVEARLGHAVRLHQTGQHEAALAALVALVNDKRGIAHDQQQRARVYLGEVLYLKGDKDEARQVFESILTADPDYVVDPFAHPPDVCGFFETIRAYMRPIRPTPAPIIAGPRTPPPLAYAGFGIYQFRTGRPGLGAAMAGSQAVLGALSVASFLGLAADHTWATDGERTSLNRKRAVQWGATAGFYGVWMWSVVEAHQHVRQSSSSSARLSGAVYADSAGPAATLRLTVPLR